MPTNDDNVIPLHTSAEEDRNVMAYLTRECEKRGWNVSEVLEKGFPETPYVCSACEVPLMEWSNQLVQLDGRTWHKPCRAEAKPVAREPEATRCHSCRP